MLTYTGSRNEFGTLTNNSTSSNLTNGDRLINESIRRTVASHDWPFMEKSVSGSTVANQQFYELPSDAQKLINVDVVLGTTRYNPLEAPTQNFWDDLNRNTGYTSNAPQYYFVFGQTVGLWPTSSTGSATISYTYRKRIKDLSVADYTAGTVGTATAGSSVVYGSATAWNASMAGRYLQVAESGSANAGDGFWYEISSVTNGTTLVLTKNYSGLSIASGNASYTIGQTQVLPEEYQMLPIYESASTYWQLNGNAQKALYYKGMYNELYGQLKSAYGSKTTNVVVEDDEVERDNPNFYITA